MQGRQITRSTDGIKALIADTAKQVADVLIDHIHNLMRDTAGEIADIRKEQAQLDRTLRLHEAIMNATKGSESNG